MQYEKIRKESFCVIGKAGSTEDGAGFIARLWEDANSHFSEAAMLAKHREDGSLAGIWGAMSDVGMHFLPWEDDFSKGVYLAGVEVRDDAAAPAGWTKWTIPGYVYLKVKVTAPDTFPKMIAYMDQQGIKLAGAVHDFTEPTTGENYMFFPIEKI